MDRSYISSFLRYFFNDEKRISCRYVYLPDIKELSLGVYFTTLSRVLRLTRHDVRGWKTKPWGSGERTKHLAKRRETLWYSSQRLLTYVLRIITFFSVADLIRLVEPIRGHVAWIARKFSWFLWTSLLKYN